MKNVFRLISFVVIIGYIAVANLLASDSAELAIKAYKIARIDEQGISEFAVTDALADNNSLNRVNDEIIVDDQILSTIATRVASNIRELEGVFNKLVAFSTLANGPITIEMAEKAINDISAQKEKVISADYIQDVVAKYFNINKKDLRSAKRSNDIAYPRQIAMYLCREVAGLSNPKIG